MNSEPDLRKAFLASGLSAQEAAKRLEQYEKEAAAERRAEERQAFQQGLWFRNLIAFGVLVALFTALTGMGA
jgi:hypothetical protein